MTGPLKVAVANCVATRFKAHVADTRLKTIASVWLLDGKRTSKRRAARVHFGDLSGRKSTLTLSVKDDTPLVRNDPKGVQIETRSWRIIEKK